MTPGDDGRDGQPGPLLVTVDEAGRLCAVGRSKMYELIARGEVPSVTIGRARRVPLAQLRDWIDGQLAERASTAAD